MVEHSPHVYLAINTVVSRSIFFWFIIIALFRLISRRSNQNSEEGVVDMAEEGQVIGCHTVEQWKEYFEREKNSQKLVVVDFTASWCPPCRFIAPIFAEMAKKMTHVLFLKVDVDELKEIAEEYEVQAMPTFIFMKEGKVFHRILGANKDELQATIEKHAQVTA